MRLFILIKLEETSIASTTENTATKQENTHV